MHQAVRMVCSVICAGALYSTGVDVMSDEPMAGILLLIAAFFAASYFIEAVVRLYKEIFR